MVLPDVPETMQRREWFQVSHDVRVPLVAENPGKCIGAFSQEFLRDFMQLLRLQYGTRRVRANEVYQEYIKDKNHYHINATKWETLTGFVMFLGRTGTCEVEPSETGWYIKYIDRSPETLARQEAAAKKQKMDKDDEERIQEAIEKQITRALASKKGEDDVEPVYTELKRENEDERIVLNLKLGSSSIGESSSAGLASSDGASTSGDGFSKRKVPPAKLTLGLPNALKLAESAKRKIREGSASFTSSRRESRKRKRSTLYEIRMMKEERKRK